MAERSQPGRTPTALLKTLADGSCRTIDWLEEDLGSSRRKISNAAACLLRRDYLMRMAAGCYQLTEAGLAAAEAGEVITSGSKGPRSMRLVRNTFRERAWRSMRMRRKFTLSDIIRDAAREDDKAPRDNLGRYLRALQKAGVVSCDAERIDGTAPTSNGFKFWTLVRDLGPHAPVVLSKVRAVRNRATGEDLPCSRA